jgi:stress response protein YsnF
LEEEEQKEGKPGNVKRQRRKRLTKAKKMAKPISEAEMSVDVNSSMIPVDSISPASITNYETLPLHAVVTPTEIIVKPETPKSIVTVIRPRSIVKEESIGGKAAELAESVREKTEDAIDTLTSSTGLGVKKMESNLGSEPLIIPVIEQKIHMNTKSYTEIVRIEKRMVEKNKSIDVTLGCEELFVNGKQVHSGFADTLKEIKDKLLDVVSLDKEDEEEYERITGEKIPLYGEGTEAYKMIPIYAEEAVLTKKLVKVAEVVIRKRQVKQVKKVDVGTTTGQVTVVSPGEQSTF